MTIKLSRSRSTLVRALHRRKGRDEEGAYLAEGERLVRELAGNPDGVRFLVARGDRVEWVTAMFPELECCVIEGDGGSLFATEHAQGVAAVVTIPRPAALEEFSHRHEPILYLDRLADPGNVGTILRTADWFGIDAVVLGSGTADPYNPKAVRASMGAIIRMHLVVDVPAAALGGLGLPVLALDAGGGGYLGDGHELPRRAVYAVGSEAHGIDPWLREHARLISIRGSGRGESLNAAMAAGLLLYELHRAGINGR